MINDWILGNPILSDAKWWIFIKMINWSTWKEWDCLFPLQMIEIWNTIDGDCLWLLRFDRPRPCIKEASVFGSEVVKSPGWEGKMGATGVQQTNSRGFSIQTDWNVDFGGKIRFWTTGSSGYTLAAVKPIRKPCLLDLSWPAEMDGHGDLKIGHGKNTLVICALVSSNLAGK